MSNRDPNLILEFCPKVKMNIYMGNAINYIWYNSEPLAGVIEEESTIDTLGKHLEMPNF